MDEPAVAIGRLAPDGADWVGIRQRQGRYDLVIGHDGLIVATRRASPEEIVLAALVYFAQVLEPPPAEVEATHEDVANAVRRLAAREDDPRRASLLTEAIDAIDDGLAADEVMNRLAAALPADWRDDPAAELSARAQAMTSAA